MIEGRSSTTRKSSYLDIWQGCEPTVTVNATIPFRYTDEKRLKMDEVALG